ncbi:MAG: adenylosuccinate lyase [Candidatus Atribacteria bacterium]|nr:adenylosuccinate lyase [Candidatus Atribacteria bacterium]
MIERYTLPAMAKIWSDEHRFETWLKVELLALEGWSQLGLISPTELETVKQKVRFSQERMGQIEKETRHDVIAFLTTLSENLGAEARFLHFGLTSSDMLDTANAVLLRESADLILDDINLVLQSIQEKAQKYRYTLMAGRTHGVQAEPTTFGLKMALWFDEMKRNRDRLQSARERVRVGKISGAVGNYANVDPRIEEYVCKQLDLIPASISTQIIQRDRYAEFLWSLAMIGGSLEKFAVELRSLQRTEIREVEEGFAPGQKGSSAMPHKKNPITGEQICGLSRVLRGNLLVGLENIPLWHERDISHSSAERIVLPDSCILTDYLLNTFRKLIDRLVVYPERMMENLEKSRGLVFSERVLLELVKKGLTREEAYLLVQEAALKTWDQPDLNLLQALKENPKVVAHLTTSELEKLFDYDHYLDKVDFIFKRVGIDREDS